MIAQILWFSAGFITSAVFANEINAWLVDVEAKLEEVLSEKEIPAELKREVPRDYPEASRIRRAVKQKEDYIQNLIKDTMQRLGIDTKEANMNKTISQISKAVAEAYDKYGGAWHQSFYGQVE